MEGAVGRQEAGLAQTLWVGIQSVRRANQNAAVRPTCDLHLRLAKQHGRVANDRGWWVDHRAQSRHGRRPFLHLSRVYSIATIRPSCSQSAMSAPALSLGFQSFSPFALAAQIVAKLSPPAAMRTARCSSALTTRQLGDNPFRQTRIVIGAS